MISIDGLPIELLQHIFTMLDRNDLVKFRLVAPRRVLPEINALVFKDIFIDVDGTDNLTRYEGAEEDGVALRRLKDIAASRIVEHVNVLTLRLTRPYSMLAFYEEKLGVVKRPFQSLAANPKRRSGIKGLFDRMGLNGTQKSSIKVNHKPKFGSDKEYAEALASALRTLFSASDLVTSIRITQPNGYNSEYDIVYPSVYGRVLVRLLTALKTVNLPKGISLELQDCPVSHLEESGLKLDIDDASVALAKFTSIAVKTRTMGYQVHRQVNTQHEWRRPDNDQLAEGRLGLQLLSSIKKNTSNLVTFEIGGSPLALPIAEHILSGGATWSNLQNFAAYHFNVKYDTLKIFMEGCLPHLHSLILSSGTFVDTTPVQWSTLLDSWVELRNNNFPDQWALRRLYLSNLRAQGTHDVLSSSDLTIYVKKLIIPQ
ncbi:hypothetical protein CPB86DRAFT_718326 [Serendipita vermifera]|nr:hypothetical protein CPB86DRAFT_718326 [Serendipita vermifera]